MNAHEAFGGLPEKHCGYAVFHLSFFFCMTVTCQYLLLFYSFTSFHCVLQATCLFSELLVNVECPFLHAALILNFLHMTFVASNFTH